MHELTFSLGIKDLAIVFYLSLEREVVETTPSVVLDEVISSKFQTHVAPY